MSRFVIHTHNLKHTVVDARMHHVSWCIERLKIDPADIIAIEEYHQ